jgi:hypothetical protein
MITTLHDRAIGQLLALDNTPLGTGFLITAQGGRGKVLTAGHVVDGHKAVKIRFDKADGQERTSSGEIVRGAHDWALLTIDSPAQVAPLALYPPPFTTETVRWWTIGYPDLVAYTRASFHGDVRIAGADEFDLHCVELPAGAPAVAAAGLSGAPCLIDGGVAGILRDVLRIGKRNPTNPTAAVFALPSWIVAREAGLPYVDGTKPGPLPDRLPYELLFTATVQPWPDASRQIAAGIAKLDRDVVYPPSIIARRMINEGIDVTGRVLRGLRRPIGESGPLIDLAETVWVNGQAALHMDEVIEHGTTALLLTDSELSTRHHLSRAFACRNDGDLTWDCVHIGAIDGDLDEIVAEVDARLRDQFGDLSSTAVEELIESDDAAGHRVTVFLHGAPRDELTGRLKSRWAKLRIVYFIKAEVSTDTIPGISVIMPRHDRTQEEQAMNASKRWRHQLGLLPVGGAR